jgi:hypothetical protein
VYWQFTKYSVVPLNANASVLWLGGPPVPLVISNWTPGRLECAAASART